MSASWRSRARKGLEAARTILCTGMFLPWQRISRSVPVVSLYSEWRAPAKTAEWSLQQRLVVVVGILISNLRTSSEITAVG